MLLVLSGYVKDDLERIFQDISRENKFLITSKKHTTEKKKQELKQIFKEVIFVDEYYDSAEVEIRAIDLHKRVGYSRIVTPATGEFDILRAAQLREYLGLDGQGYESALAFRDKYIMKTILSKAGITTPLFQKVNSVIDLLRFIDQHRYPVIIKPTRGVASLNTHIFYSYEDIVRFFTSSDYSVNKIPMMVESFVEGKMFHVDGLIINGEIAAVWPSAYLGTALDMINGKYFANHLLGPDNPLKYKLVDFARRVVSCLLSPRMTAFHLELFQDLQGELVFCEIASRSGGGYTNSIWFEAFGIPLRDAFYYMQAGLNVDHFIKDLNPKNIPSSVVIPKKTGVIGQIEETCSLDYVHRYVPFYKAGDQTERSVNTMNPLLSAFIVGNSEHDTFNKINEFLGWVNKTVNYK